VIATSLEEGRYELGSVVGRGGMALVYRARDLERGEVVAVKVLADNLAADPELRRRFAREALLAERLSHPNVVSVLAHGETDGRAYIVLEYVDGRSLADELKSAGRLPAERVIELGAQAAAGLAHAHEQGLVHRDVKPHNLLLAKDGTLKVSDFGIARLVDGTQLTQIGTVLGTAEYLAPEQAAGEETTGAADVYALGAVMYELLTGEPPYRASTLAGLLASRRDSDPAPPSALAPNVSVELDSLVLCCLQADPARRPSAQNVELTLRGKLEAPTRVLTPASERPTSVLRRAGGGRRRGVIAAALAGMVALALALGFALANGGTARTPPPSVAGIAPIPSAQAAAQEARNLARWLRRHSR
jgi:eukaryotic-like serine/threonine-protein kinase